MKTKKPAKQPPLRPQTPNDKAEKIFVAGSPQLRSGVWDYRRNGFAEVRIKPVVPIRSGRRLDRTVEARLGVVKKPASIWSSRGVDVPIMTAKLTSLRGRLNLKVVLKGEIGPRGRSGKDLVIWDGPANPSYDAVMESMSRIVEAKLKAKR